MVNKVTMLTGASCGACKTLKSKLESLGLIDQTELVDAYGDQGKALVASLGIRSIPVLIREGHEIMFGANHDIKTLEALYV